MTGITVREIEERDRGEYLKMSEEFYDSPAVLHSIPRAHMEKTFAELMDGQSCARALIAEKDGAYAGYILLALTWSQEAGGKVVWIDEVYVRPSARGCGAGTTLLREAVSRFPAARYRLEIEPDNVRAKKLYELLGYKELGYVQMYSDNETHRI